MLERLLILICTVILTSASELTFELPDNANQCFYEEIKKGIDCTLEFQVIIDIFKNLYK
jgi:protein ERP2